MHALKFIYPEIFAFALMYLFIIMDACLSKPFLLIESTYPRIIDCDYLCGCEHFHDIRMESVFP